MVIVGGNEEEHPEGAYYFQVDGKWERISESAAGAQEERNKGLARQWYQQQTGEKLPEPESKGTLLRDALDAYLSELELKVASRNRKHRTLALMKQTLNEFAQQCEVRYLQEITATHMSRYTAWTIQHSPTKSARTGRNKFLRVLQFLKYNDAVPTVGIGRAKRPLGMRDAPRVVEQEVSINTPEELKQFFAACGHRQLVTFQTFNRSVVKTATLMEPNLTFLLLGGPNMTSFQNGIRIVRSALTLNWPQCCGTGSRRTTASWCLAPSAITWTGICCGPAIGLRNVPG
jgi:hypothetical protein